MPLYEVETPSGQRIQVSADSPLAAAQTATAPRANAPEESFANKLRYYAGPHLSEAAENIGNALSLGLEYLSPAGDINGLVEASRDSWKAMRGGDAGNALLNLGLGGASLAALFVPGPNPKLAMDEASRMARAKDMGYATEVYHGTDTGFSGFDPRAIGSATDAGQLGRGFYSSTDPNVGRANKITMPLKAKVENPLTLSLDTWGSDKTKLVREALGLPDNIGAQGISDALRARGYDSVILDYSPVGYRHQEVMVLEPTQYRSRFAKFDPTKKGSANLLAGIAAGGLIAPAVVDGLIEADEQQ